ncbi:ranBP-type and C3HC4-type zinc finger-containing protein 1 [Nephila pilipes]|uniref:RanBP-type and C3HC4-type zinc finger-containing protein 1 n=1 Tax=Nephila pilipes TaxID=299642 RepID=A0A8X6MW71_NEPPI|nr:ranBP-type and C3HC4-type zinc finger-containing protein 1 [Nephila pilipes]
MEVNAKYKMSCEFCRQGSHSCQPYNHHPNYGHPHYSDVQEELEEEPEAPNLSLGNRILWLTETRAASGIVRWIGRIPTISAGWSTGVEFDNVMPNGGNGDFKGRNFFNSRPGHALFLPVSDLIKVDSAASGSANGERSSFFGRLQDSCSNFAHRKRRDSTFGHFKQEYCSNCNHNDLHCNGHHYNNAPVYDRITSRRSMYYEDQPYETYNACTPCGPLQGIPNRTLSEISNSRQYGAHRRSYPRDERYRLPDEESEKAIECPKYHDDEFRMARKDSIFNPRSSLSFINGFKEWVSCLVLGTSRRKSNRKLVLKDRKSVTSVFLSNNSQSVTGQRLSSFSEYASISISKGSHKSSQSLTRQTSDSANIPNHEPVTKRKSRKKRPAPLPPIQYNRGIDSNSEEHRWNRLSNGTIDVALNRRDSQRDRRSNKIVSKTVKSTNSVTHSIPVKKRYKKRRAPPPPAVLTTTGSAIYATVIKKDTKNAQNGVPNLKSNEFAVHPVKHTHHRIHRRNSDEWDVPGTSSKISKHRTNKKHLKKVPHLSSYATSKNSLVGSDLEDSSSGSISFSPNESGDDKYGLVNYRAMKVIDGIDGDTSIPRSSSYVQYSSDNSDVCLKISIQKTETNVVTVEEVPAPHTARYTIEEDTSSSELSDEPPVIPLKIKSIDAPHQELKANSTDSSTVSTEENGEQSKTIFEELKLKPPVKGSVKDFVHAFNMLASKSNGLGQQVPKQITNDPVPKDTSNNSGVLSSSKNIQSFPTKWEFQNNKAANLAFSSSQFLLPIAEESLNETSEHDGNVEESKGNHSDLRKLKNKKNVISDHKHLKYEKTVDVEENASTCSHCSEKHSPASTTKKQSTKKRTAPYREKSPHTEKAQLPTPSTKASMLALSSLLQEKTLNGKQDAPSHSSKPDLKLDQPIMVGLYIEDKSSHRGPIPLLVTPSMSLRKLKKQVEAEYDFPRHQQCWILGESFAVQEDASLASFGVTEAGCPILLYVMAKESKSHSLPCRASTRLQTQSSSSEEEVASPRQHRRRKSKPSSHKEMKQIVSKAPKPDDDKSSHGSMNKKPQKENQDKSKDTNNKKKSEYHKAWEEEYNKKADYRTLLALDDVDLVANMEPFECPVCFLDVDVNEGIVLQDCLHNFCRECLSSAIQYSDTAVIKCPFRNDEYSCESHLQEREIKCLVSPEVYDRHLQRSMALAESQARDSFHCKTPDCPGWCLFEDNVNTFLCPVCKRTNCLTCAAIHEGRNCRQYQDHLALSCDTSEEAKKTKEYLQNMVENGEAMECPQCLVILMKKWGCDWLKCSMCHTEVCWVTKGPRWGPGGKGDTSGGCKCMLNGVRCHPKCSYCH